jgi:Domain of unknown function (DUF5679)
VGENDPYQKNRDHGNKKGYPMEAYCMKCKQKREMKDPQPVTMKNGKPATTGTCATCGTKLFKIGKAD